MEQKDLSKALQGLSDALVKALPAINEKIAGNAYAMMKTRIIDTGTIGENESLGNYSEHELPTFYFKGKALIKQAEDALKKADKQGDGISYKNWRLANNRPVDHVTLSFSGTTLNDIGVIKSLVEGAKIITIVGSKNSKTRKDGKTTEEIVGYLKDQYGDFIKPNNEEIQKLKNTLEIEVQKVIKAKF